MKDNKKIIAFVIFAVLTVVWMLVIFGFSSNNADDSTEQSNVVTEIVLRIFKWDFDELSEAEQQSLISQYDGLVRKLAHFTAYAVLAFLWYLTVYLFPLSYFAGRYKPICISFPLCVVFAVSDEYHQSFVDGRAGRFSDVLIDSSGALFGTALALAALVVVNIIIRKRQKGV